MNADWGVIKRTDMCTTVSMETTRVCAVCGANELGYTGSYYSKPEFWLCPECLEKLKKLLDEENNV